MVEISSKNKQLTQGLYGFDSFTTCFIFFTKYAISYEINFTLSSMISILVKKKEQVQW
jgi:hypothetical protein